MSETDAVIIGAEDGEIAASNDGVDRFVTKHFGVLGTFRLHRAAIGWDLLAAPLNVMLAPIFLLSRLTALVLAALRVRRASQWILAYPIFLHSAVARAVEQRIEFELWPAVSPQKASLNDRQRQLLRDYTSVRTSVAEIFTTLVVLALGFYLFRNPTPGIVSLTPFVSDLMTQTSAVANFPFGQGLGQMWYAAFPPVRSLSYVITVGISLALVASLVTTFAGIIADPIQAYLGIHRRRLLRLLEDLDASDAAGPVLAREHVLARLADISDAGVSLFRMLR
ncbi:DUF6635 family protein [Aliiruegeria lutimaris]|uniref:Uncharacterized protein n=1 Tax=Aliiruegeria lutimaris TaxID=571298 RepID=A0A1G8X0T4_9RHOB|nr:DUF6635 family protein [Aliiruegeria lutimaris]SDJ83465.1 hypothetical protein SAMN04488026_102517 [Aliiruegeria lutimaris]